MIARSDPRVDGRVDLRPDAEEPSPPIMRRHHPVALEVSSPQVGVDAPCSGQNRGGFMIVD